MNFVEAVKEAYDGKKITRAPWKKVCYFYAIHLDAQLHIHYVDNSESFANPSVKDYLADDWIVVNELKG